MPIDRHALTYLAIGTLATLLAAFDAALVMHQIPIPVEYAWVAVIVQPVLVYLCAGLNRLDAQIASGTTVTVLAHATPAPVVNVSGALTTTNPTPNVTITPQPTVAPAPTQPPTAFYGAPPAPQAALVTITEQPAAPATPAAPPPAPVPTP